MIFSRGDREYERRAYLNTPKRLERTGYPPVQLWTEASRKRGQDPCEKYLFICGNIQTLQCIFCTLEGLVFRYANCLPNMQRPRSPAEAQVCRDQYFCTTLVY
jgi:hypothetical protein